MLLVISPAKTLDYDSPWDVPEATTPDFLDDAEALIDELRQLNPPAISELMGISAKLADLNFGRYLNWSRPFTADNAKPAALAFQGDVYTGLDAASLTPKALAFGQDHLRILSGLYGLLRPLDLMQPYRLEMGTKFANARGKDLYAFWGERITEALNAQLDALGSRTLVNLASNEYFKAVRPRLLDAEVITPVFKDYKGGKYKVISFYAKKARGLMARYVLQKKLKQPEKLKDFDLGGYRFNPAMSEGREWVFTRDSAQD